MKNITIAKSAGFCFGVKRALRLADEISKKHKNVYMLGDIVHNPRVVNEIKKLGIRKIRVLNKKHQGVLLIRAHGAPEFVFKQAKSLGYRIIDATCPMVKEIQTIAKKYESLSYQIIIIGDKKHDEVLGIKGNLKNPPLIVADVKEIASKKFRKIKKAAVVVQSTQNTEKVKKIVTVLYQSIKNLVFCNTICHPTRQKQDEMRRFPLEHEIIIIIGAKNSANTKRLYQLSKNLNRHTYWVNSKQTVKKKWFKGKKKIGIAAGASTPDYLINEIKSFIKSL